MRAQLTEQDIRLEVSDDVKQLIAEAGYDSEYGARPLRRVIQDKLEDRLSEGLLAGEFKPGDVVDVVLGAQQRIDLVVRQPEPPDASPELAEPLVA